MPGTVTAAITPTNGQTVTIKSVEVTADYTNPATMTYPPMTGQSVPVEVAFKAWLYYPIAYGTTVSIEGTTSDGAACSYTATNVYDNTIS